jgi:hypothetical protein
MSKPGPYTKATGPLAGTYASYYQYQNIRAQSMGHPSYGAQRVATGIGNPLTKMMIERAVLRHGENRASATTRVRGWFQRQDFKGASVPSGTRTHSTEQGKRKQEAIAWLIDQGWITNSDEDVDEVPY